MSPDRRPGIIRTAIARGSIPLVVLTAGCTVNNYAASSPSGFETSSISPSADTGQQAIDCTPVTGPTEIPIQDTTLKIHANAKGGAIVDSGSKLNYDVGVEHNPHTLGNDKDPQSASMLATLHDVTVKGSDMHVTCAPVMPIADTVAQIPPGSQQDVGRKKVDGYFATGKNLVYVATVLPTGQLSKNPDLTKIYKKP